MSLTGPDGILVDMTAGARATDGDAAGDDEVQTLQRWEASGAVWRVLRRGGGTVTIALLTCDGGEQVGEVSCEEDAVAMFLAGRESNAD